MQILTFHIYVTHFVTAVIGHLHVPQYKADKNVAPGTAVLVPTGAGLNLDNRGLRIPSKFEYESR